MFCRDVAQTTPLQDVKAHPLPGRSEVGLTVELGHQGVELTVSGREPLAIRAVPRPLVEAERTDLDSDAVLLDDVRIRHRCTHVPS